MAARLIKAEIKEMAGFSKSIYLTKESIANKEKGEKWIPVGL